MSEPQTETYICGNCGGTLRWNIQKQAFLCSSCGTPGHIDPTVSSVQEHPFDGYAQRAAEPSHFPDREMVVCKNCGAQIIFNTNETAKVCPMCASTQINIEKQLAGVPPDGIIPFRVDKPQAQDNFRRWLKSRWFAPNQLKKAYQQGKLDGVYLPFWTYDADAYANYTGQGGRTHTRKGSDGKTHTEVVWTPVAGSISTSYDDIQVCASEQNAMTVIDGVLPYSTSSGCAPYAGAYMSGFGAERYSFGADVGFGNAKQTMEQDLRHKAEQDIRSRGFEMAQVFTLQAQYSNISYKHVLLPAWLSAFAYHGKEYLYVINGENGRVNGQRPYSIPKIVAASLVALAIVLFFLFFFQNDDSSAGYTQAAATQYSISTQWEQSHVLCTQELPHSLKNLQEAQEYGLVWSR